MAANNTLLLTSIDFDGIKSDLKSFLSNQTELGDYDYDSSTMQVLLNLLAYNTYKNSFYLNMVGNEMFLDSAQIRGSVVSRSKMLGYTPRSARGPIATVQLTVTPDDAPDGISLPANTVFSTSIDGINYVYTNPDAYVINTNSVGVYSSNITLVEGNPLTHRFVVSSESPIRYIIPNDNVDTSNLSVRVQESVSNTSQSTWTRADNLVEVTANSQIYFLNETEEGRYEISFGDNVLGKQLNNGNIVVVGYRVCNGTATQGANVFTTQTSIDGYSNYTILTLTSAEGGAEQESIQSIKYNAPKSFQTQNRAVTFTDYENAVKTEYGDITSVSVWGGEDNDPPIYGKVYISVKPQTGFYVSDERKDSIRNFLSGKNVLSITPEIVDPTYLFVVPTVDVKYNPNLTTSTAGQIADGIGNAIIQYEATELGVFGSDFVGSEITQKIYAVNDSLSSIKIGLKLMKNFVPTTTARTTYQIPFNTSLLNITGTAILRISPQAHPGRGLTVSSSSFTFQGQANSFFDDDGFGNLRIYYINESGVRVYTNRLAGTVNYTTGLVTITNVQITSYVGGAVNIYVDPDDVDVATIRNQLLTITEASVNVFDNNLKKITATASNIGTQGSTTTVTGSGIQSTVF
jgi:hypothetical protein